MCVYVPISSIFSVVAYRIWGERILYGESWIHQNDQLIMFSMGLVMWIKKITAFLNALYGLSQLYAVF